MHQLTSKSAVLRPAHVAILCAVVLVVGILYVRHAPRPDEGTTHVRSVQAAAVAVSGDPTTTQGVPSGAADRVLAVAGGPEVGVGTATTIAAPVALISLSDIAAQAETEAAAAEVVAKAASAKAAAAKAAAAKAAAAKATTTTKAMAKVTTTTKATAKVTTTTKPATVAVASPTTTTTTTTTPGRPAVFGSGQSAEGTASWFKATNGTCAHPTLPFGTIVRVTRLRTGATATCRVNDRGPYDGGRLIDLSDDVFESLAPIGAGLMPVRIEW